jgi:subtilisin family serine protease
MGPLNAWSRCAVVLACLLGLTHCVRVPAPPADDAVSGSAQSHPPTKSDVAPSGASGEPAKWSPTPPRAVPNEYLVKFRSPQQRLRLLSRKLGIAAEARRVYKTVPGLQLIRLGGDGKAEEAIAKLRTTGEVEYIEPNYITRLNAVPNDPRFQEQWALHNLGGLPWRADADIDATEAWDITTGSPDVVVAVIDTGIEYAHTDLAPNVFVNTVECVPDGTDNDGNGYVDDCHGIDVVNDDSDPLDDAGHGTHVAGIIAANGNDGVGVAGVAWRAKVMPCKFADAQGEGNLGDAIACFDYVSSWRDRGVNVVATNNSWGVESYSRSLGEAVERHMQRGILMIAAAGNSLDPDGPGNIDHSMLLESGSIYPCAYPFANVICVAMSNPRQRLAEGGMFGFHAVHVVAPGEDILSTLPGNSYGLASGTSMATPHVTGVAALVASAMPTASWTQIRNRVLSGGDYLTDETGWPDIGWYVATRRHVNAHGSLACANASMATRVWPRNSVIDVHPAGVPILLGVYNINCGNPAGPVTVAISPGGSISLRDDGVAPDQVAQDGLYTANWIPQTAGTFTLAFPTVMKSINSGAPGPDVLDITVDTELKPGFPTRALSSTPPPFVQLPLPPVEAVVTNLDDEPDLEIVVTGTMRGPTYGWKSNGESMPGWPLRRPSGRNDRMSVFSAGNLLGTSDRMQLVGGVIEFNGLPGEPMIYGSPIEAYDGASEMLPAWQQGPVGTAAVPPTLIDVDGDGIDEIFVVGDERHMLGYNADATPVGGLPLAPLTGNTQGMYSPVAGDIDNDGVPELFTASDWPPDNLAIFRKVNVRAAYRVETHAGDFIPEAIGDVDGDGKAEVIGTAGRAHEFQIRSDRGVIERTFNLAVDPALRPDETQIALADIEVDGIPEIVVLYSQQDGYFQRSHIYLAVYRGNGTLLPGWPVRVTDVETPQRMSAPTIGDIDGDGRVEIVLVADGVIHARNGDGTQAIVPKVLPHIYSYNNVVDPAPIIADIDADGRNEVIATTVNAVWGYGHKVAAYDFNAPGTHSSLIEWGQKRGGAHHNGYYETGKNLPNDAYLAVGLGGDGSITSNIGGIACGSTCLARLPKGTTVQLTAAGSGIDGAQFLGWSGACEGQGNPCAVRVDRYTTTRAEFGRYWLGVGLVGTGTGRVTSSPAGIDCTFSCSRVFEGTPPGAVTLTATPSAESVFTGWTGACSGTTPTCVALPAHSVEAIAHFTAKKVVEVHIGNSSGISGGRVTSSPAGIDCPAVNCRGYFTPGITVTLTASPPPNGATQWLTPCTGGAPTCTVRMESDHIVVLSVTSARVAASAAGTRSGRIVSAPAGIDCGAVCNANFAPGTLVRFTASAEPNSRFTGWSGACSGTTTDCTLMLAAGTTDVIGTFQRFPVLTVARSGNGSGSVSSAAGIACGADCSEVLTPDAVVVLEATSGADSVFTGWSGACTNTGTTCTVTMNEAKSVTANFALMVSMSVVISGSGSVTATGINCGSDCAEMFVSGSTVTFTANPNSGNEFAGWSGACAGSAASCTVVANSSGSVTATFRAISVAPPIAPPTTPPATPPPTSKPAGGKGGRMDLILLLVLFAFVVQRARLSGDASRLRASAKRSHRGL